MAIHDDVIRERHGCECREAGANSVGSITIWEVDNHVFIDYHIRNRYLTAWQARYLAAKLYRLSRRIRARSDD